MEMWQLQQLQGLPLEVKIRKTQERIKEWYEFYNGQVYVSFSGGKDSTVLLDIVRKIYPEIVAVFVDTGLEYPEIREFVKGFDNVTWLKPKMNFKQVIEKYGYPVISKDVCKSISEYRNNPNGCRKKNFDPSYKSRFNISKWTFLRDSNIPVSHKCCDIMKKKPCKEYEKASGNKAIIGTMTEESQLRQLVWLRNGCNGFENTRPVSNPISFWTEQDILHYIKEFNIPYCSVYGKIIQADQVWGQTSLEGTWEKYKMSGCSRTGCMWCMFGIMHDKEPNRFQMMKETHPKQYDYCINKLGLREVLDFIKAKY